MEHDTSNVTAGTTQADETQGPIEDYKSWKKVEFNITYGSGIPQPKADASDVELLW